jgi:ring-1,2-phenylacetyl-CoA epoxidase subunit PaaC
MSNIDLDKIQYLLRLADSSLILGHRLSEWAGHGPILEEDIAMSNIALDLIGQSRGFYTYACEIENAGKTEDDLAYLRDTREFKNLMLLEQPNGDFGKTMTRQFLFDAYCKPLYRELSSSKDETIAALAAKSLKEVTYHLRHASEWMIRLGDGTEESHDRVQKSVEDLWKFTGELFDNSETEIRLIDAGIAIDNSSLKNEWDKTVSDIFKIAGISQPSSERFMNSGSFNGNHTEHLGYILAEMQALPRAYPGAKW